MNRLANETSLYLRQHAHNPVDWFPWGPDALAAAKERNQPIFLSVGYSACHWCHVMERESFEDAGTAAVMNEHFVCVKVDREERPDLDHIYMTAHQLLTREGGGWPLSVWLTPDLTPFYAGTYFPPRDMYNRPGFRRVLASIADAWRTKPDQLAEVGRQVTAALQGISDQEHGEGELSPELLANAGRQMRRAFDTTNGGFGHAPKFPHPLELALLLRLAARSGDESAKQAALFTLQKMARGGMYDQVGGGFHRYSVDAVWLVPHFEKMLYDNALLAPVYADAYRLTGDEFYKRIACETLDYVVREMTAPGGAFFSTLDADSEGEEGKFYVWSADEIGAVLGADLGAFARNVYGVTESGNFEGHNIAFRARSDAEDAKRAGLSEEAFRGRLTEANRILYEHRTKRVWPGRDQKILTSWNGLMIAAFARAGAAFGEPKYVAAATRAADAVLTHLRSADGRLFRTALDGQPGRLAGYLEDYAFLADALAELYQATFEPRWLLAGCELADAILAHFADPAGGFFDTADDHEALIVRTKNPHDNAWPSGTAMAATALLKLAVLCDRPAYREAAERTLTAYHGLLADSPMACGQLLSALDFHLGPVEEIAVAGPAAGAGRVLAAARAAYKPNRVIAFHDPASGDPPAAIPLLHGKTAIDGSVTVYVCRNYACAAPLTGPAAEAALRS